MRMRLSRKGKAEIVVAPATVTGPGSGPRVGHRQFLKMLAGAAGVAGVAQLVSSPRPAEAADGTFDNLTVNGSEGIGTSSPSAPLHVYRSADLASVKIESTGNTYNFANLYLVSVESTPKQWMITHRKTGTDINKLMFWYHNGSAWITPVTVDTTGNVGIGTTSPSAALHVGSGSLKIGTRVIADGDGAYYA